MKWEKATPQLKDLFAKLLPDAPIIERRQMFGLPCAFVNGHMFAGCFGLNSIILRLSESQRDEFLGLDGAARFEPSPGRIMKEYVVAPQWMMTDEPVLAGWLHLAIAFTASLPPKTKRVPATRLKRQAL
jgi:TfoX/Sxy family transcriptional regulator of competence genes